MSFNPYLHLSTKVRRLLESEAKLTEDERRANQWQLLLNYADTKITIGKGDVNTIFYQFGENGKRRVCYPDQILDRLKELAAQPYFKYSVQTVSGKSVKNVLTEKAALAIEPAAGYLIYGVDDTGEHLVWRATGTLNGREWSKPKSKSKMK